MRALVYRNTKTTLPGWVPIHDKQPRGIAYETDTHFVHIYGTDRGLWVISIGLTATEKKSGSLLDWVQRTFGAVEIAETNIEVGETVSGVWRPGLIFDEEVLQGLAASAAELRLAEQALLLLVHRLDELLMFIEPSADTLKVYGHKTRELLILACTEVENFWKHCLRLANVPPPTNGQLSTNDYVKLKDPLFLDEYEVRLPRYSVIPAVRPFHGWDRTPSPTKTLLGTTPTIRRSMTAVRISRMLPSGIVSRRSRQISFCSAFGSGHSDCTMAQERFPLCSTNFSP